MTEQELDLFMRNVLLDAIAQDEETNTETIPYTPSLHHQKQIKAMLKNPLRWARDRERPVWKFVCHLVKKRTPSVLGPQWQEMVQLARVTQISRKSAICWMVLRTRSM